MAPSHLGCGVIDIYHNYYAVCHVDQEPWAEFRLIWSKKDRWDCTNLAKLMKDRGILHTECHVVAGFQECLRVH